MGQEYRVIMTRDAEVALLQETMRHPNVESGGNFIGTRIGNIFYLREYTDSGIHAKYHYGMFERDYDYTDHLAAIMASRYEYGDNPVIYCPQHRHPDGIREFSVGDRPSNIGFAQLFDGVVSGLVTIDPKFCLRFWYVAPDGSMTPTRKYEVNDRAVEEVLPLKSADDLIHRIEEQEHPELIGWEGSRADWRPRLQSRTESRTAGRETAKAEDRMTDRRTEEAVDRTSGRRAPEAEDWTAGGRALEAEDRMAGGRALETEDRTVGGRALEAEDRMAGGRALEEEDRMAGRRALEAEDRMAGRRALGAEDGMPGRRALRVAGRRSSEAGSRMPGQVPEPGKPDVWTPGYRALEPDDRTVEEEFVDSDEPGIQTTSRELREMIECENSECSTALVCTGSAQRRVSLETEPQQRRIGRLGRYIESQLSGAVHSVRRWLIPEKRMPRTDASTTEQVSSLRPTEAERRLVEELRQFSCEGIDIRMKRVSSTAFLLTVQVPERGEFYIRTEQNGDGLALINRYEIYDFGQESFAEIFEKIMAADLQKEREEQQTTVREVQKI